MNILATSYSLKHKSLDIYLAGCNGPHCPGCHNPESWDFQQGTPWRSQINAITTKIRGFSDLIERVMVMGGEPLDQPYKELLMMLSALRKTGVEVWLFTHYDGIQGDHGDLVYLLDYVKTGAYDQEKLTDTNIQFGVKLASSNQRITKLK